jgi:hypothetical protein
VARLGANPFVVIAWGCARRRQPGRIVGTEAGPGRRGLSRPLGSLRPLGGLPAQRPDARPARRLLAPLRDRLLQRQPRHPAHRRPGAPARDPGPGHRQRVPGSLGPAPAPTRSSRWPVGTVEESGSNQASTRWSATSSCWLIGPWRASAGSRAPHCRRGRAYTSRTRPPPAGRPVSATTLPGARKTLWIARARRRRISRPRRRRRSADGRGGRFPARSNPATRACRSRPWSRSGAAPRSTPHTQQPAAADAPTPPTRQQRRRSTTRLTPRSPSLQALPPSRPTARIHSTHRGAKSVRGRCQTGPPC